MQLRISELKQWDRAALDSADEGEAGAVAALMTYYLGLRCSEIVGLKVRDVDDGATVLWVWADNPEEGKTEAAQRELRIPPFLRTYLLELVEGKEPDDFLFSSMMGRDGRYDRTWVLKWVKRICQRAGVRTISAHGMRGKRSSRAIELGVIPDLLARDMGHESTRTTLGGSYVTRAAIEEAERQRRIDAVKGKREEDEEARKSDA